MSEPPIGYITKEDMSKLQLGAGCVDLFGNVVPKGVEMIPVYVSPAPLPQLRVTDEMIRVALLAFQSGDMDWSSQDEELMRFAIEEAIAAAPMFGLLKAARPYVEDRLHRADGEIDGSVSILLKKIDAALSATPEGGE